VAVAVTVDPPAVRLLSGLLAFLHRMIGKAQHTLTKEGEWLFLSARLHEGT
jgi:hypothetical protein